MCGSGIEQGSIRMAILEMFDLVGTFFDPSVDNSLKKKKLKM